jgi:5-(carboxyamino)imidazole ribonucleotide synthase
MNVPGVGDVSLDPDTAAAWTRLGGASGLGAHPHEPDWPAVLALPGVRLHLYGKAEPRRGRKMGHLTVTAPTAAEARAVALQAAACLGLPAF